MAKTVKVTSAQVKAAEFKASRTAAAGKPVPGSVRAIAAAKSTSATSAQSSK